MKTFLKWIFHPYIYGECNGRVARKNVFSLEVQFVLWKAGEQGYKKDYWHPFNSYWWDDFKPSK